MYYNKTATIPQYLSLPLAAMTSSFSQLMILATITSASDVRLDKLRQGAMVCRIWMWGSVSSENLQQKNQYWL